MSKIFSLVILVIVCSAICKEAWQCDAAGKYTCSPQQTCCRSAVSQTGWSCFPVTTGVCCSDGKSICPSNTICNLKEKRCDKKGLTFLQMDEFDTLPSFESLPTILPSVEDTEKLAAGFWQGVAVLNGLAHQKECFDHVRDPKTIADVLEIIEIVKNLNYESDFLTIFKTLSIKGVALVTKVEESYATCKIFGSELDERFGTLGSFLKADDYIQRASQHTMLNVGGFIDRITNSVQSYRDSDYFESGRLAGDIIKFGLFWDFKMAKKN